MSKMHGDSLLTFAHALPCFPSGSEDRILSILADTHGAGPVLQKIQKKLWVCTGIREHAHKWRDLLEATGVLSAEAWLTSEGTALEKTAMCSSSVLVRAGMYCSMLRRIRRGDPAALPVFRIYVASESDPILRERMVEHLRDIDPHNPLLSSVEEKTHHVLDKATRLLKDVAQHEFARASAEPEVVRAYAEADAKATFELYKTHISVDEIPELEGYRRVLLVCPTRLTAFEIPDARLPHVLQRICGLTLPETLALMESVKMERIVFNESLEGHIHEGVLRVWSSARAPEWALSLSEGSDRNWHLSVNL